MDLELPFTLIEKLQTLCNELISKFELQQKFTFYTLKKNVYKLQCDMNKNVNIYDNNTRDEIKRKINLLDYNTDCIIQLVEIQINENKAIPKFKIIYMNIKEKNEIQKLQIIEKILYREL